MNIENLEYNLPVKTIQINGQEVEVKQYLNTARKSDILDYITLEVLQTQYIDQPRMDAVLNALIVLNYTNIKYKCKNVEEMIELYDYLEVNGIIEKVIGAIPSVEYNALISYFNNLVKEHNHFKVSPVASVLTIAETAPELMERIGKLSKEIDYKAIETLLELQKITG